MDFNFQRSTSCLWNSIIEICKPNTSLFRQSHESLVIGCFICSHFDGRAFNYSRQQTRSVFTSRLPGIKFSFPLTLCLIVVRSIRNRIFSLAYQTVSCMYRCRKNQLDFSEEEIALNNWWQTKRLLWTLRDEMKFNLPLLKWNEKALIPPDFAQIESNGFLFNFNFHLTGKSSNRVTWLLSWWEKKLDMWLLQCYSIYSSETKIVSPLCQVNNWCRSLLVNEFSSQFADTIIYLGKNRRRFN